MTTTPIVTFTTHGNPATEGSTRIRHGKITHDNPQKLQTWRNAIIAQSIRHAPPQPIDGPVAITINFYLPPGKTRLQRTNNNPAAEPCTVRKGDLDKLTRAVLDALHINTPKPFFKDDAQITQLHVTKNWADQNNTAGATITISKITETK